MANELERIQHECVQILRTSARFFTLVMEWVEFPENVIAPMLRGQVTMDEFDHIQAVKKLIETVRTKGEITLYRGLHGNFATHILASARAGYSFDRATIQSFTSDRATAIGFTSEEIGCCLLKIAIPVGTPIFYISAYDIVAGREPAEEEYVLPPGRIVFTGVAKERISTNMKIAGIEFITPEDDTEEMTVIEGTFLATEWPPLILV